MREDLLPCSREDWIPTRVSNHFSITLGKMLDDGRAVPDDAEILPYIRAANLQEGGLDLTSVNRMPFTAREARLLAIRAGDLLVVEGGAIGVNVYMPSDMEGWSFQKTVNRARAKTGASTRFLGFVLDVLRTSGALDMIANKSTIAHLTAEKLERIRVAWPTAGEQREIVAFLDREVAEIDAFTTDQEELIALLAERRSATISRLVTLGLDSSVPLKDSGIEWLGPIPRHWTTPPVVALARVLTSTVDKKDYDGERTVRLCNYTDVYYGDRITSSEGFMEATASTEQIRSFSVRKGDVPFTKDSETADDIGVPALVEADLPDTVYGYHLSIYRPYDQRWSPFFRRLLESDYVKATFATRTPGVTRVGLSQNTIRYLRVPCPPIDEAVAIAAALDDELSAIDSASADAREAIALLRERRAALIAAAVTGKIDVRGHGRVA